MSENINIVARRIFNKLSDDISDRRGIGDEWDQISPNVKSVEIRGTWEQIFIEEIEKHTAELQSKVSDLEEANRSNLIVMSALQNAHEMEKARVNRLEDAGDKSARRLERFNGGGCDISGMRDNHPAHIAGLTVKDFRLADEAIQNWNAAKDAKP